MLNDLLGSFCEITAHAFKGCASHGFFITWASSEGGQLFLSTLLGAIVGAVVAGGIQYSISKTEFKHNIRQSAAEYRRVRRREAADQLQRNKATALNIGVKAITLTNQMYSAMGLIIGSVGDANASGFNGKIIADKMVPMTGISSDPLQFSSEELAFLFWSNEAKLANELMLLNEKNRSLTDAIQAYSERRTAFPDVLESGSAPLIQIRQQELRDLANGVCQGLQEDFGFALNIMEELPKAFDRTFKENSFFKAEIPGGGRARLQAFTNILEEHDIEILN